MLTNVDVNAGRINQKTVQRQFKWQIEEKSGSNGNVRQIEEPYKTIHWIIIYG